MPKSRRLRRTKRMRGGDAMPTATTTTDVPTETTATAMPTTTTTTMADKLKNVTRKAADWLSGLFVDKQPQMGGRRRKTRRHRSRKH